MCSVCHSNSTMINYCLRPNSSFSACGILTICDDIAWTIIVLVTFHVAYDLDLLIV